MAREFLRDAPSAAPPLARQVDGVGPTWGGDEALRKAAIAKAREDRPSGVGLHFSAPYIVPGAPPELRSLVGELIGGEQKRRDMAVRLAALAANPEASPSDLPRVGSRGDDEDLRKLALGLLEGTAVSADLRLISWEWLRWAAFFAPQSCEHSLVTVGECVSVIGPVRELLEQLAEHGPDNIPPTQWIGTLGALRRTLEQGQPYFATMALWTLRHGLSRQEFMRATTLAQAAGCWVAQGGDAVAGLSELGVLIGKAPAWPVGVPA